MHSSAGLPSAAAHGQGAVNAARAHAHGRALAAVVMAALQGAAARLVRAVDAALVPRTQCDGGQAHGGPASRARSAGAGAAPAAAESALEAVRALSRLAQAPMLQPLACAPELTAGLARWLGRGRAPRQAAPLSGGAAVPPSDAEIDGALLELAAAVLGSATGYSSLGGHVLAVSPRGLLAAFLRVAAAAPSPDELAFESLKLSLQMLLVRREGTAHACACQRAVCCLGARRESAGLRGVRGSPGAGVHGRCAPHSAAHTSMPLSLRSAIRRS